MKDLKPTPRQLAVYDNMLKFPNKKNWSMSRPAYYCTQLESKKKKVIDTKL